MQAPYLDKAYKQVIERGARLLNSTDCVLEIGCGTGIVTVGIASHVSQITGYDVSGQMLDIARTKALQNRVSNAVFRQGDGCHIPESEGAYDAVLCCYMLDVVEKPVLLLREAHRLLKANGKLFTVTDCRNLPREPIVKRLYRSSLKPILFKMRKRPYRPSIYELRRITTRAGFITTEETLLHGEHDGSSCILVSTK